MYRLNVRREEPDFELVAVPHATDRNALNLKRGGREVLDVIAFRRRGMNGAIRISAEDLPPGVECPEVWLGPNVDRATVVVSANRDVAPVFGKLKLMAYGICRRVNGFLGKMHTELAAPGRITDIDGIRGRGETFTGQTDKGSLQIAINDDAPLGRQSFLRLLTVGVVEDQATYFGSNLLPLEIIE